MKRVLTGIKPTSDQIHLGNYFGALKNILKYQNQADSDLILFIADLHGMNTLHEKGTIGKNSIQQAKLYLACGLDPENTLFYRQSDVPGNVQLSWVLSCITHLGFMKRMHAFKDALAKGNADDMSMGSFNYPILMAADILLYDVNLVPVGKDQKQHIEFARDIAEKFNRLYGNTFVLPDAFIEKEVATIPGIDGRKMSKSYNNYIGMLDPENVILKKIKRVVTDNIPVEESKDPDSCNVYNILKLLMTPKEDADMRKRYTDGGLSYKDVKMYLFDKVMEFVGPIQAKVANISDEEVEKILQAGAIKANEIADRKIKEVYGNIGF